MSADVTYMFNPEGVARLLRSAQIAFSQTQARRILVISHVAGGESWSLVPGPDVARLP